MTTPNELTVLDAAFKSRDIDQYARASTSLARRVAELETENRALQIQVWDQETAVCTLRAQLTLPWVMITYDRAAMALERAYDRWEDRMTRLAAYVGRRLSAAGARMQGGCVAEGE